MVSDSLTGNQALEDMISTCFQYLAVDDRRNFLYIFGNVSLDPDQFMHTYQELLVGACLCANGFQARYERKVEGQTADWTILNETEDSAQGIIEVTNFHIDQQTRKDIQEQRLKKGMAAYWRDGNKINLTRLYDVVRKKAEKYTRLVQALQVPYLVSVFGDSEAVLDLDELWEILTDGNEALFPRFLHLSGL